MDDDYIVTVTMALLMEKMEQMNQTDSKSQVFLDLNSLFDLTKYDNIMLGLIYDNMIEANKNYNLGCEYLKIIKMCLDIK